MAPADVTADPSPVSMQPPEQAPGITPEQLERAVRAGIITAEQRERLERLAGESSQGGPPGDAGGPAAVPAPAAHERTPLVLVAYTAGALAVLFAFGWFLVERWRVLGPGGVLVVVAVYAAIFAVTSWWLLRQRFPVAAAFAALLAVGMTPVATWSVLRLTGFWEGPPYAHLPGPPPIAEWSGITRWAIIELATALAALVTYRFVPFAPLAVPVAVAGWLAPLHLGAAFVDPLIAESMFGWGSLAAGAMLLLAAYAMDRRTPPSKSQSGLAFDAAGWVYRVFLVAMFAGVSMAWRDSDIVPHGLILLAALGVTVAMAMGRRELLAASVAAFVWYLGYLAFEVFERVLSFPVVLASFGIALILLTVAAQRRWPTLAARLDRARSGDRRLPGDFTIPAALLAVTLLLLVTAPPRAHARLDRDFREQLKYIRTEGARIRREQAAAGRAPGARPVKPVPARPSTETPPPSRP